MESVSKSTFVLSVALMAVVVASFLPVANAVMCYDDYDTATSNTKVNCTSGKCYIKTMDSYLTLKDVKLMGCFNADTAAETHTIRNVSISVGACDQTSADGVNMCCCDTDYCNKNVITCRPPASPAAKIIASLMSVIAMSGFAVALMR